MKRKRERKEIRELTDSETAFKITYAIEIYSISLHNYISYLFFIYKNDIWTKNDLWCKMNSMVFNRYYDKK